MFGYANLLKPLTSAARLRVAGMSPVSEYKPSELDFVVWTTSVLLFWIELVAPGMTTPLGSLTRPETTALLLWALSDVARTTANNAVHRICSRTKGPHLSFPTALKRFILTSLLIANRLGPPTHSNELYTMIFYHLSL